MERKRKKEIKMQKVKKKYGGNKKKKKRPKETFCQPQKNPFLLLYVGINFFIFKKLHE